MRIVTIFIPFRDLRRQWAASTFAAVASLPVVGVLAFGVIGGAAAQEGIDAPVPLEQAPVGEQALPAPSGGAATMTPGELPHDLSPWGMFMQADVVVKAVMIGLVLASVLAWAIWLAKVFEMRAARRRVRRTMAILSEARTLAEAHARLHDGRHPAAQLVRTAVAERESAPEGSVEALKERVSWLLSRVEASGGRRVGWGMGALASIGAIAPFVGLFGTVWGIMNAFIGIAQSNTTNLAVVAPGIAEALLATALGLFAAIPAVIMYNAFARSIGGYRALLGDASTLVMRLVSLDCERAALASGLHRTAE